MTAAGGNNPQFGNAGMTSSLGPQNALSDSQGGGVTLPLHVADPAALRRAAADAASKVDGCAGSGACIPVS